MKRFIITFLFLLSLTNISFARETSEHVNLNGNDIYYTMYYPDNEFNIKHPLIVLNHGTTNIDNRKINNRLYYDQAKFLQNKGFVVVVPFRQGYGSSTGSNNWYTNYTTHNNEEMKSVLVVIDNIKDRGYIDKDKIILMGQSGGGCLSVAMGSKNIPGIVGIVSFAGGLKIGPDYFINSEYIYKDYGAKAKIKELWIQPASDTCVDANYTLKMQKIFNNAGGNANVIMVSGEHNYFLLSKNIPNWWKYVSQYFKEIGVYEEVD